MKADFDPLSGDPMREMTVGEWADAMIAQLQKLPVIQAVTFMNRMTSEQRDLIRTRIRMQEEAAT